MGEVETRNITERMNDAPLKGLIKLTKLWKRIKLEGGRQGVERINAQYEK